MQIVPTPSTERKVVKLKIQLCLSILLALFCFGLASAVHAAALSEERNTPERSGDFYSLTVCSNVVIYKGAIVSRDADGYAIPAGDTTGTTVIGCAPLTADNRAANYHASRTIAIAPGIFGWAHTGFTDADIGQLAYVLDDQTVTPATNVTYDIVAGVIVDVDGTTCWVDTGNIPRQGAQSVASIAVAGAATVGTTLGVTGAAALDSTLAVAGDATFSGTTSTFANNVAVTKALTVGTTIVADSTVSGSGFKIGAQAGWTGVETNGIGTAVTNYKYFAGGLLTNSITTALP